MNELHEQKIFYYYYTTYQFHTAVTTGALLYYLYFIMAVTIVTFQILNLRYTAIGHVVRSMSQVNN